MEKRFNSFEEFKKEKIIYKSIYEGLSYQEKREYKKYVYSLKEREFKKDLIWEYLNEPMNSEYFVYITMLLRSNK